ncbi:MAG: hypothetical protein ABIK73_07635 [candidate division WOR-3 bacterium]
MENNNKKRVFVIYADLRSLKKMRKVIAYLFAAKRRGYALKVFANKKSILKMRSIEYIRELEFIESTKEEFKRYAKAHPLDALFTIDGAFEIYEYFSIPLMFDTFVAEDRLFYLTEVVSPFVEEMDKKKAIEILRNSLSQRSRL